MAYIVYFITHDTKRDSPVKIGVTRNLERRIESFQTASPAKVLCTAMIPCETRAEAFALEAFLHRKLRRKRVRGEWFKGNFKLKEILSEFSDINNKEYKTKREKVRSYSDQKMIDLENDNQRLRMENISLKGKLMMLDHNLNNRSK